MLIHKITMHDSDDTVLVCCINILHYCHEHTCTMSCTCICISITFYSIRSGGHLVPEACQAHPRLENKNTFVFRCAPSQDSSLTES